MTEEYTVDDWIELEYGIENIVNELDLEEDDHGNRDLANLKKASDFIKSILEIKTDPIIRKSALAGKWYCINIWTEKDELITAYSKRPATDSEMSAYYLKELESIKPEEKEASE